MPSAPGGPKVKTNGRSVVREARINAIVEKLLEGKEKREAVQELAAILVRPDGAPLSDRLIDRDFHEAWRKIRARFDAQRDHLVALARVKWERRERLADEDKDRKAGNVALANWTRVVGAYAPTRAQVEVTGQVEVNVNLQARAIVGVLSERGLAAMRVLHEEIEAARLAGKLPALPAGPAERDPDDDEDDDDPVPVPSSGSVN